MESIFRDELAAYLGTRKERKKILREIVEVEREELGLPPVNLQEQMNLRISQKAHALKIAQPKLKPVRRFSEEAKKIQAPSSKRGKGCHSPDELFRPVDLQGKVSFWLYDSQKVTQSTLEHFVANAEHVSMADLLKSDVIHSVHRKIDNLMEQAKRRERCGILFDIVSTSKIIKGGIPHQVGNHIYEYIESRHYDAVSLKFVFVGITDNDNCCAARDVFCRDELLNNKFIGDRKRNFEALDNIHMFPVFPFTAKYATNSLFAPSPTPTNVTSTSTNDHSTSQKRGGESSKKMNFRGHSASDFFGSSRSTNSPPLGASKKGSRPISRQSVGLTRPNTREALRSAVALDQEFSKDQSVFMTQPQQLARPASVL